MLPTDRSSPDAQAPIASTSPSVSEPALASNPGNRGMTENHKPFDLPSPVTVVSGLCVKSTGASNSNVDYRALSATVQNWMACLQVDQDLIERLFHLWNTLLTIEADEISDWSLQALCSIVAPKGASVPAILGVAATVYANGEVSCAITVEGFDPALSFLEVVDLSEFEAGATQASTRPGASA